MYASLEHTDYRCSQTCPWPLLLILRKVWKISIGTMGQINDHILKHNFSCTWNPTSFDSIHVPYYLIYSNANPFLEMDWWNILYIKDKKPCKRYGTFFVELLILLQGPFHCMEQYSYLIDYQYKNENCVN